MIGSTAVVRPKNMYKSKMDAEAKADFISVFDVSMEQATMITKPSIPETASE